MENKMVLDVCCGSKMFWFNKDDSRVLFMDSRTVDTILSDKRKLQVRPDIVGDFRNIPLSDNSFNLVVFDPPHLVRAGENSWLAKKYGVLSDSWKEDLSQAFDECIRVLKPGGVLIFKWNEEQVKLNDVLSVFSKKPLFGNRRSKTIWVTFIKGENDEH